MRKVQGLFVVLLACLFASLGWAGTPGTPIEGCKGAYNVDYIIDAKTFEDVSDAVANNPRVIVVVRADWCEPCCESAEMFRMLAEKFSSQGLVFVNVEWSTMGAKTYEDTISQREIKNVVIMTRARGFPTMAVFLKHQLIGNLPFAAYPYELHERGLQAIADFDLDKIGMKE
jgi:hypothetical protein